MEGDKAEKFIEICKRCDAFFKETIENAISKQRVDLSEDVAFYLMGILIVGLKKEPYGKKTVGEEYLLAQADGGSRAFKDIGDSSLIIAGIWWRRLLRKIINVDYYLKVGKMAYQKASENSSRSMSEIFDELSVNFKDIVDILNEATRCISEVNISDVDTLRLYECWQRTDNPVIEKRLRELGINPVHIKISIH